MIRIDNPRGRVRGQQGDESGTAAGAAYTPDLADGPPQPAARWEPGATPSLSERSSLSPSMGLDRHERRGRPGLDQRQIVRLAALRLRLNSSIMSVRDDGGASFPDEWQGGAGMGLAERQAAERIAAKVRKSEPWVTGTLREIVTDQAAAELMDLGSCLKRIERIEEKLLDDVAEKGSLAVAEAELFDALRYTIVITADYVGTLHIVIAELRRRGTQLVRSKNSWGRDGYQAINAVFRGPDGNCFEVQFHTPASRACRNDEHHLYERLRDPATGPAELDDLLAETIAAWRPVCQQAPRSSVDVPNLP